MSPAGPDTARAAEPVRPATHARRTAALVATATVAALVVRLHRLGAQSLWMDEGLELTIAAVASPWEMVRRIAAGLDKNPPLYHIVVWVWTRIGGDGEAWLRLPSALAGTAAVPATWLAARRLAPRGALAAAVVVAVSPLAVWYSQEARMYALLLALGAWSLVAWLRAAERPSAARMSVYVAVRIAAAYTHPYALFLAVPEAVQAWRDRRLRRAMLLAALAQAALYAPWAAVLLTLASEGAGFEKGLPALAVPYTGFTFLFGFTLGPGVADLHMGEPLAPHLPTIAAGAAAAAVPAVRWLRRGSSRLLVTGWAVAPVALAVAASAVSDVTYNVRYVIFALPAAAVAIGDGLARLRPAWRAAAAVALAALVSVSLANWWGNPHYAKDDFRGAARVVQDGWRAGDDVVVNAYPDAFDHYTSGRIPRTTLYRDGAADEDAWSALRARGLREGTAWIVWARPWETDRDGAKLRALLSMGRVTAVRELPGTVRVFRLEVG